jgi:arsenate reductase (thioredoxin)
MDEIGVDLPTASPTKLTDDDDVIITMGCGDACPVFPGRRYLDGELPHPAGKGVDAVRAIRNEIDIRVQALLRQLVPDRE